MAPADVAVEHALCAAMAAVLQAGRVVAAWGLALSVASLLVLAVEGRSSSPPVGLGFGLVALLGVVERYLAARVALDAALFGGLATGTIASLPALDAALAQLGLRARTDGLRPLDDRLRGARALLRRHGGVVAAQTALFALAIATKVLR